MYSKLGPRIAIYSQDGLGLGHLRRNSLIGRHLLEQLPESSVLLFADSPVAPFFRLPDGMDHIKLPSLLKIGAGHWRPTRLPIPTADLQALRTDLLRQAFLDYRPDLLLVDHMPHGAQGELLPALQALKQARPECHIVLGLREILDRPKATMQVWQTEGAYEALGKYYSCILIYGNSEVFDTARTYRLPTLSRGIHYCGYVVNLEPVQTASHIRQQVRASGQRLVFVSAGGGHDGYFLMRMYLEAIRRLGPRAEFTTLMAVGVNAPLAMRCELDEQAKSLPVQIVPYVEDSLSHIAAADLVVCMAGYNTLAEVLHLRKKALVVPRSGPSAEQTMRAKVLNERGLIDVLYPETLSSAELAERILTDLDRDDYPAEDQAIDTTGGQRAATRLLALMDTNVYATT
jgi:predicted glycosyltransferase